MNLLAIFQEPLTSIARLRLGWVPDDGQRLHSFTIGQIRAAKGNATRLGFTEEEAAMAAFAVAAFLDESVLSLDPLPPTLQFWAGCPAQKELFDNFQAGTGFFGFLTSLRDRPETGATVALLELYAVCLFMGHQGQYANRPADLRKLAELSEERVRRIRGALPPLSVRDVLPRQAVGPDQEVWKRRWRWGVAGLSGATLALFIGFQLLLQGQISGLVR